MTTVSEIESVIEKLSLQEIAELAAWFDEHQERLNASAGMFALYDQEEVSKGPS